MKTIIFICVATIIFLIFYAIAYVKCMKKTEKEMEELQERDGPDYFPMANHLSKSEKKRLKTLDNRMAMLVFWLPIVHALIAITIAIVVICIKLR